VERHHGQLPDTLEELLELPGIGIKVAGIVLVDAFGKSAVSVDTHVHRIVNRLGLVRTSTPEKTSAALHRLLPQRTWRHVNVNLVALGQTICRPIHPHCEICPLDGLCPRLGVLRPRAIPLPAPRRRRQG
jgi:endonuclease-3